jgi:hypothetical protein
MISGSPWINNRLEQPRSDGSRTPWVGPLTDIVSDPFAILRAAYDWDAFFVPESGAYTDLAEATAATDGADVYRWVNSKGLSLRFTQRTAGNRPTYTANAIGTRAGMVFSGTDTMTYDSNVLLTGDHFLFGVFKYSSNGLNNEGPIKTRNADGGDDRVILMDGVFGTSQRLYTTPIKDFAAPTTGNVFGFDVSVASGSAWESTTKTSGTNFAKTNIDQLEIRPAAAFPTLTVGAIGYILKSKLTGGDTDILAIINDLKTLYGI